MIPQEVRQHLYRSKIEEIDMPTIGKIVLERTIALSLAVNREIIAPISKWLADPLFLEKYKVMIDNREPNWTDYKRKQRLWTKIERQLQAEKMKIYWQEIRKKRRFRKEVSMLLVSNKNSRKLSNTLLYKTENLKKNCLVHIIAPFSPKEQQRAKTNREFLNARTISISNLLPWKILLSSELSAVKHFKDLKVHCPLRRDTISKLKHLLQMETDGEVNLHQDKPFEDVKIKPLNIAQEQKITIKDQNGREYHFDWQKLNDCQRNKIIMDIKANRILCKTS